jgi:hypothetical protein
MAASMKMDVFIALMMEAESTFETSVSSYQSSRRNNPENSRLREWKQRTQDLVQVSIIYSEWKDDP